MAQQFVIWGKAPGETRFETILVSENAGLKSMDHAKSTAKLLEDQHGCTETRVQALQPLHEMDVAAMFRGTVRR